MMAPAGPKGLGTSYVVIGKIFFFNLHIYILLLLLIQQTKAMNFIFSIIINI